jgi:hypothetical protein
MAGLHIFADTQAFPQELCQAQGQVFVIMGVDVGVPRSKI